MVFPVLQGPPKLPVLAVQILVSDVTVFLSPVVRTAGVPNSVRAGGP